MRLYEGLWEKRGKRESREYNMETQLLPRDDVLHTHTHTHTSPNAHNKRNNFQENILSIDSTKDVHKVEVFQLFFHLIVILRVGELNCNDLLMELTLGTFS